MQSATWLRCYCGKEFSDSVSLMSHKCDNLPKILEVGETEKDYSEMFDKLVFFMAVECVKKEFPTGEASHKHVAKNIVGFASEVIDAIVDKKRLHVKSN